MIFTTPKWRQANGRLVLINTINIVFYQIMYRSIASRAVRKRQSAKSSTSYLLGRKIVQGALHDCLNVSGRASHLVSPHYRHPQTAVADLRGHDASLLYHSPGYDCLRLGPVGQRGLNCDAAPI